MQVWLNGEFIDGADARVSIFDAGFQHAVGLFETMRGRNGRVFRTLEHMERLVASACELMLSDRLHAEPLAEAVGQTLERNEAADARLRLTITGGNLNLLGPGEPRPQPTIIVVAQPPTAYPDSFFEEGVVVAIADGRANPLDPMAGHKTLNYWPRIHALQRSAPAGASETIWFTVSNHLACGSVSNVLLVKDDTLLTPIARGEEAAGALAAPVLPGITRAAVIQLAAGEGIPTEKRMLDINDLLGADEVMLTNSSWGVLPVVAVERERIAAGTVGPVTHTLRAAYLDLVERETA